MGRLFTRTGGLTAVALFVSALLTPMIAQPAQAARTTQAAATHSCTPTTTPAVPVGRVAGASPVYFKVATVGSHDPLVIQLTDLALIDHARRVLSGVETVKTHVMGRIIKRPVPYNPHYSFHLDPSTISFFAHAIEVCDATLTYTEDHLDEACGAFLPGCFFCPWTSKLVGEIPTP